MRINPDRIVGVDDAEAIVNPLDVPTAEMHPGRHLAMPLTPEKVWPAIRGRAGAASCA